jgi:hypothetical protein
MLYFSQEENREVTGIAHRDEDSEDAFLKQEGSKC